MCKNDHECASQIRAFGLRRAENGCAKPLERRRASPSSSICPTVPASRRFSCADSGRGRGFGALASGGHRLLHDPDAADRGKAEESVDPADDLAGLVLQMQRGHAFAGNHQHGRLERIVLMQPARPVDFFGARISRQCAGRRFLPRTARDRSTCRRACAAPDRAWLRARSLTGTGLPNGLFPAMCVLQDLNLVELDRKSGRQQDQ